MPRNFLTSMLPVCAGVTPVLDAGAPCVLHIHFWADIRNDAGSVEKVITSFAAHGRSFRHAIACCPAVCGKVPAELPFEYRGVPVFPFRENRLFNRLVNKMLGLRCLSYFSLVRLIKRLRPEVLHFHNRQELVDSVMKRLDYRPAVFVHYHRDFSQPVIPVSANHLFFVSHATQQHILSKCEPTPQQSCSVLFNPLSLEVLEAFETLQQARSTKPSDQACSDQAQAGGKQKSALPMILFGGGGIAIKGGAELLSAFSRLPANTARLVLAGNQLDKLLQKPVPDVEVLGRVSARDFFDLMQQADIVAMPSHHEPFGLIAQEAMLLRRLLLVSNCGGLAEFTGSDCAVVFPPKDVDALYQALCRALSILRQPQQRAALLDCAEMRVQQFFPAAVNARLEAVYAKQAGRTHNT